MIYNSLEDDTEINIFNFMFVQIKRFTTNFLSLLHMKTSPSVRVTFLEIHRKVKTAEHEFKILWGKWS
jgi:hypothetical protein